MIVSSLLRQGAHTPIARPSSHSTNSHHSTVHPSNRQNTFPSFIPPQVLKVKEVKKKKKKMAKSVLLLFLPSSNSFDFHLRQVWMPHSLCLTALSAYSLLTGGCFQITTPGALFAIFTKVLLFGVTPSEVSIIRKTRRAAKISSSTGKASEPGLRGVAARRGAEAYLWGMPVAWALVCSPDSS